VTRHPQRSLAAAGLAGAVVGAGIAVVLVFSGVGAPIAAWVLLGAAIGIAWWTVARLLPGESGGGGEPAEPTDGPRHPLGSADRDTRALERHARGALRGSATTVAPLHEAISEIARAKAGDGPYPPALAAYLARAPVPLSRRHLRTILKELTSL